MDGEPAEHFPLLICGYVDHCRATALPVAAVRSMTVTLRTCSGVGAGQDATVAAMCWASLSASADFMGRATYGKLRPLRLHQSG